MVRGFALFGVLLVNMYNFGAPAPVWTGAMDRLVKLDRQRRGRRSGN